MLVIKTTPMKTSTLSIFRSTHPISIFFPLFLILLSGPSSFGQSKADQEWSVAVGLGMAAIPSYPGDDTYQAVLIPSVQIQYGDRFFASLLEGVGYNVIHTDRWRIGPILKNHIGRYEDGTVPSSIIGDQTDDLIGLGDVGFTFEPGGFMEFTQKSIITKLEIRQGLGGHKGLIGELRTEYKGQFKLQKKRIYYRIGPEIRFANSRYHNAFFGIDAEQAANTDLDLYDAESGLLSYGLNSSLLVPINQKISILGFARYQRLGEILSDAPLLKRSGSSNQSAFGFLVQYTF